MRVWRGPTIPQTRTPSGEQDTSPREDTLHGEHHVTGHFEPAAHKGARWVQFAFNDGNPILIADGYGDIGLLDAAGDEFTFAIDDFESPYAGSITGDAPLKCLCHTCSSCSIKMAGHCFEKLINCHC